MSELRDLLDEWLTFYNEVITDEWWGQDADCAEGERALNLAERTANAIGSKRKCIHHRQNDKGDACLDCGAVRDGNSWE